MDRNSVIGLALIFLILMGTIFINQPTVEEAQRLKRQQDSLAALAIEEQQFADSVARASVPVIDDSTSVAVDSMERNGKYGMFAHLTQGQDGVALFENEKIQIEISKKGGAPQKVWLKPYFRALKEGQETKDPLILFEADENRLNYTFVTKDGKQIRTDQLYFTPSQEKLSVTGDSAMLTMTAAINEETFIQQVYTLDKDGFMVGYDLITKGFDKVIAPSNRNVHLTWSLDVPLQEQSVKNERNMSTVYYQESNGDYDYIGETKYESQDIKGGSLNWISFKQQFFNSTLISTGQYGFTGVTVATREIKNDNYVKGMDMEAYLPLSGSNFDQIDMAFFFGPNHFQILKAQGHELQQLVPLGWGIFGWVNRFIVIPVFNFLHQYISSFGIIILMLTLIIKFGLLPLVYKSYLSTAKMRVIKPEIDELKDKFGKDPAKMQTETMKLYRKAGVNPLGGCMPMLLQMPILIALFRFFPVSFELRQQSFLWATDLSTYDSIWDFGYIPVIDFIYGDHVSLFTLLMTISTLIYTRLNNQISGMTGQMKYIGYLMPIVFLGFFNSYASGLTYYYFLSNVITFGQQYIIRKFVDDSKIQMQIQENKKKPVKKSKFAEKMEKMAKMQQQQMQQRNKK